MLPIEVYKLDTTLAREDTERASERWTATMATQFLASHGVDVNALMAGMQLDGEKKSSDSSSRESPSPLQLDSIVGVRLPKKPSSPLWDVKIIGGLVSDIVEHDGVASASLSGRDLKGNGRLLAPSLCHAHVHLDKCFIIQDEKYSDLTITKGDFAEAMALTGEAKTRFEEEDLLRRGRRLIAESVESGVTMMRAFVEVDEVVSLKCVQAAIQLKKQYRDICEIQICAFAQLPLFAGEDGGKRRRELMEHALALPEVEVIGSTPYVEEEHDTMRRNITWTIEHALSLQKHLDFHLDYNLTAEEPPMIWCVMEELRRQSWEGKAGRDMTICLGHCTRLTLFEASGWRRVKRETEGFPVSFIGLPTSDIFIMGRPEEGEDGGSRVRGTLQIPEMINKYGLQGSFSINNVGNSFTPQGSCDPLSVAALGVGIYQSGTQQDTELLYVRINKHYPVDEA